MPARSSAPLRCSGKRKDNHAEASSTSFGAPPIVELHIDDQMDIKTLLGTYVCSDLPGEFHWQPGVLTQAVVSGRWVVVDDIDRAPFDILSSLTNLIENHSFARLWRSDSRK